ncbi:MAG TPA: ATPase, T2SS/T4P/T4SS family [Burkholderiales bacterium]|nr:ATPase, T2SS/T4P/T4SS family [Burkholderiales bacterium]
MSQEQSFVWPTPPYYQYASAEYANLPRGCVLVGSDGRQLQGELMRFLPEQGTLDFVATGSTSIETLEFARIKKLQLLPPVQMVPRELEKMQEAGVAPPTGNQIVKVSFKDGEKLAGETRGFLVEMTGLYLYLSVEDDKVQRTFIPTHAFADYSIGPSLGEMLSAQQKDTVDFVQVGLHLQRHLRSQRIGDYLTASQIISREFLEQVLKDRDQTHPESHLGQVLLREEVISKEELDKAVSLQQRDRKLPLGEILVEMGVIDRATVNRLLVRKLGIPFVDPARFDIDQRALALVERRLAEKHRVMPLFRTKDEIVVAMENPTDPAPVQELRFYTRLRVVPVMANQESILAAIKTHYGQYEATRNVKELVAAAPAEAKAEEHDEPAVGVSDNALVRIVNQIIQDATERRASDIHIETYQGKEDTKVKLRIDGELEDYLDVPSHFRNAMISRIKIMSNLDISERRKPQDGKIVFNRFGTANVELRVAIMPTTDGLEDVVMRVLAAAKPIALDKMGLREPVLAEIKRMARMPYGLLLICGPTGSGKTTTLHSVLGHINNGRKKIWTAEDPIEITQKGLRQVQVNAKIGLTFAAALRSFLRLDPDVIMVGEMRDTETARTGVEASLTGHLVFSTLHTNSAPESVTRLLDLGMDPFNFADALLGVLAQRLARALCPDCRRPHKLSEEEVRVLLKEYCDGTPLVLAEVRKRWESAYGDKQGQLTLYVAAGCDKCGKRGYRGRLGLHELLVNSRAIKALIQTHARVEDIQKTALAEGMLTLKEDGIEKVLQGKTDLAQVRAVAL